MFKCDICLLMTDFNAFLQNEITGEHSCVMVRSLNSETTTWLPECVSDFLYRFVALLPSAFKSLQAKLVLEILDYKRKIPTEMKGI